MITIQVMTAGKEILEENGLLTGTTEVNTKRLQNSVITHPL